MKKKLLKNIALMLLGVMLVTLLASCSSYGKILRNFKNEGYEEIKDEENSTLNSISAELERGQISCTFHLLKKKISEDASSLEKIANQATTIIILEFSSDKDIQDAISESGTLSGMIKDIQNSEYVRDNCVLFPLINTDAKDIFNK